MKKLLFLFGCYLFALTLCGCHTCNKPTAGYSFSYVVPPTIPQTTTNLVQQSPGFAYAQPMGSAAGPLMAGGFQQAPAIIPAPVQLAPAAPCSSAAPPLAAPLAPADRRLTCEEFCELLRRSGIAPEALAAPKKLPKGNESKDE